MIPDVLLRAVTLTAAAAGHTVGLLPYSSNAPRLPVALDAAIPAFGRGLTFARRYARSYPPGQPCTWFMPQPDGTAAWLTTPWFFPIDVAGPD